MKLFNNKNLITYIIVFTILLLSIGYSSFSSNLSIRDLYAEVRLEKDVRITGVSLVPKTGGEESIYVCELVSDVGEIGYSYGDEYICDPGDGVKRTFYLLEDGDNTSLIKGDTGTTGVGEVSLIMNENIGEPTAWGNLGDTTPTIALPYLQSQTTKWTSAEVNMPTYEQIIATNNDSRNDLPFWLKSFYWTSTVFPSGRLLTINVVATDTVSTALPEGMFGVRPVITLKKSDLLGTVVIQNNGGTTTYLDYNTNNIQAGINLPNENSSVTFNVVVTNLGNSEVGIKEITGLPDNLDYEILNYNLKDKICDENNVCKLGIQKEILIKIKYKDGYYDSNDTQYNIVANFNFQPFYTVTYTGIDFSGSEAVCSIISGDLNTYGSEVKCGTEYFYVVPDHEQAESNTVSLIGKMNVNTTGVGEVKQVDENLEYTYFSNEVYWDTSTSLRFIYDENQPGIGDYAKQYKTYLYSQELSNFIVTLPTYEQLIGIGCQEMGTCVEYASWLTGGFWSGTCDLETIIGVSYGVDMGAYTNENGSAEGLGFRPILIVKESAFTGDSSIYELQTEIMATETLTIDFGDNAPENISIKTNNVETNNYTYENGILTLPNVDGNITIEKSIPKLCTLLNGESNKIGSKYSCDFGDGKRNFYILELGTNPVTNSTLKEDEVALILEGNYDTTTQTWCASGDDNSCNADGLTSKLDDIAEAWKELERDQIVLPSALQIIVANDPSKNTVESTEGIQSWLYNWPDNANYGISETYGYWTSTPYAGDSDDAWGVDFYGYVMPGSVDFGSIFGVRPVVNLKI